MQYRPLGNTGLSVSCLSFGASSLGAVFHAVNVDDCIATVHAALDGGINFKNLTFCDKEWLHWIRLWILDRDINTE